MSEISIKHYVDNNGAYIGSTTDNKPLSAIEVPYPPKNARQLWNGESYDQVKGKLIKSVNKKIKPVKYYVDTTGKYLGGTDGKPLSAIEVPAPPDDARQHWNGTDFEPLSDSATETDIIDNCHDTLKAFILCINDGTIVPGSKMTNAQLDAAIKSNL